MGASNHLLILTSLLVLLSMMPLMATSARPLSNSPIGIGSHSNLVARLNLDEGSSNCWDSMFQLQACSGEVVMFFLNGETYLGHGCCEAIRIIERQCWPALLGTLGFTTEETDVLKGYCDEAHHVPSPPPSTTPPSPPAPVDEPPKKTARVPDLEKLVP